MTTNPRASFNWNSGVNTFNRISRQVDALLVAAVDGKPVTVPWSGIPLSMWHDDKHVTIEAEVPGIAESELEVTLHEGKLTISGERKPLPDVKFAFNSRDYGKFEEVVTIPDEIDVDSIQAKLIAGVLTLVLTKRSETKPRKINISAS